MQHTLKYSALLKFALLLCVLASFWFAAFSTTYAAQAGEVTGYAWSDTVGWISMHCINTNSCSQSNYGVEVTSDNRLVGYAWSSNVGWIKFGGLSNFPELGGNARIDETGAVPVLRGWARVCSASTGVGGAACSGAINPDAGNWDGWISLNSSNTNSGNYGIVWNTDRTSSYAWGGDQNVLGWIDFREVTPPSDAPLVTISADPNPVETGNQTQISWTVDRADSCTASSADSAFDGITITNGSDSVMSSNLTSDTSYEITCQNSVTSGPVTRTVDVAVEADATTVSLTAADGTVSIGGNTELTWQVSGSNLTNCVATQGPWSGQKASSPGTYSENTGSLTGNSATFELTCYDSNGGSVADTTTVNIEAVNLQPSIGAAAPSSAYNASTGEYDSLSIAYLVRNNGGYSVSSGNNFVNRISLDADNDGSFDDASENNIVGGGLASGASVTNTFVANNITFGESRVRVEVDRNDDINESDESDNTQVSTINILPPDPGVDIWVEGGPVVRSDTPVTLRWDAIATYPMNCEVEGPGVSESFDPATDGPTGSTSIGTVNSARTYVLRCTEPGSGVSFTDSVNIETTGTVFET